MIMAEQVIMWKNGWHPRDLLNNLLLYLMEAHMIRSRELSNKPLISITDGKKVGEVKDVYLDQDMRQVAAVFLGTEGLINRKTLMIDRSAVQVYGVDVWLVSNSNTVQGPGDIPDSETFVLVGELRGREIQTEGGTKIAVIADVILDNEGRVLGFDLGKVYAQGPLADRKVIAREVILSLGNTKEPMTINLAQAESQVLPST
jgi:sporulation protein YlmC with PRC-barrel domain